MTETIQRPAWWGTVVPHSEVERNGYHDSDFYVSIWDGEKIRSIEIGSTRGGGGWNGMVPSDGWLSGDAETAAADWLIGRKVAKARTAAKAIANAIDKGDEVIVSKAVTRGKNKVAKGKIGRVFWSGEDRFARTNPFGEAPRRFGVEIEAGEKVFVGEGNLTRTAVDVIDFQAIEAETRSRFEGKSAYEVLAKKASNYYGSPPVDPRKETA